MLVRRRLDAWIRGGPAAVERAGGVPVPFYLHPDVRGVLDVSLVEAEVVWREGAASRVVLVGRVEGGLLVLRGCGVDAEVACRTLADLYKGVAALLERLGVSSEAALSAEVEVW
jgi:hypothetical protein